MCVWVQFSDINLLSQFNVRYCPSDQLIPSAAWHQSYQFIPSAAWHQLMFAVQEHRYVISQTHQLDSSAQFVSLLHRSSSLQQLHDIKLCVCSFVRHVWAHTRTVDQSHHFVGAFAYNLQVWHDDSTSKHHKVCVGAICSVATQRTMHIATRRLHTMQDRIRIVLTQLPFHIITIRICGVQAPSKPCHDGREGRATAMDWQHPMLSDRAWCSSTATSIWHPPEVHQVEVQGVGQDTIRSSSKPALFVGYTSV